jgi:hypothetical protein
MENFNPMAKIREMLLVFWPGLATVAVFVIVYFVHAGYEARLTVQSAEIEESISAINANLSGSQAAINDYNAVRAGIQPYLLSLYPADDPEALIDDIKKTALSLEVRLADIRLDVPKFIEVRNREEAISIVPFEASFTGDFFSLGRLLVEIERAPFLQNISELGISTEDESGNKIRLSVRGALRFFKRDIIQDTGSS